MANPEHILSDATSMLDEVWEIDPIIQEARFGNTTQHFTRETFWKGGKLHKKFITKNYTGARATSTLEEDAPTARKIDTTDIPIDESDLRKIGFTIARTMAAQTELDGSDHAVWDLSAELALQCKEALEEKRNFMLHSDKDLVKALVAAVYNEDGSTYTSSETDAFIQIDNGSISSFHPGEVIDVRKVDDTAVVRVRLQVDDVCHDTIFRGYTIGPGIVVSTHAENTGVTGSSGTAPGDLDLDLVADNDEITGSDETAGGFTAAIDTLCNRSSPGTYFTKNRASVGNFYLIPYGRDYTVGGSATTINLDQHFGKMADTMAYLYGPAKAARRNSGFKLTTAIVAIAPPDLVHEIDRQASETSRRFTREIAGSMDAAKRREMIGIHGWTGSVLLHSNLPPIVVQSEPLAKSGTIRIFEPHTIDFIRMGGRAPTWIAAPGQPRWHVRRNVSTGNLTSIIEASGFVIEAPFCDQPRLWYSMEGLKSSLS